jgi:hypothetical protein
MKSEIKEIKCEIAAKKEDGRKEWWEFVRYSEGNIEIAYYSQVQGLKHCEDSLGLSPAAARCLKGMIF